MTDYILPHETSDWRRSIKTRIVIISHERIQVNLINLQPFRNADCKGKRRRGHVYDDGDKNYERTFIKAQA
jgi:hypothetical protein